MKSKYLGHLALFGALISAKHALAEETPALVASAVARNDTAAFQNYSPISSYILQLSLFIIVLIIIALLIKLMYSKHSKRALVGSGKSRFAFFKLLYTHHLGFSNYIQIYYAFEHILILAVSKDRITPLLTISDKEKVDEIVVMLSQTLKPPSFQDLLKNNDIYAVIKGIFKSKKGDEGEK